MKYFPISFILSTVILISCGQNEPRELTKGNRILDNADILTKEQEDSIFYLINEVDKKIGSQIAIITIDTLNGQHVNDFALQEAQKLMLGREKEKDGVLIAVALKNRSLRIEVGYGLERIIKDEVAARLIENTIVPRFREEKYGAGIYGAVDSIRILIEQNKDLVGQRAK